MKKHSIINIKCPCFQIWTYQARLCLTFIGQVPSHLNAVVKTTKISKALQATKGKPSHGGAVTLSSPFSTVASQIVSCSAVPYFWPLF